MTAEPTSLGLSVIVAGAIAFAIWFLRKSRLKKGKAERKKEGSRLQGNSLEML